MTPLPLTKTNRITVARAFHHVPRVDLSIECVLEAQMGHVIVDDSTNPSVFKIEVGPFFYLAGDAASQAGQKMLASITPYTLFMPSAPGWIEAAQALYRDRLATMQRWGFSAENLSADHVRNLCQISAWHNAIKRMEQPFLDSVWAQDHFVDLSDFDSAEDFYRRSIGFYAEANGTIVGAAYGSLACSRGIEVSIFVLPDYRRQGMATGLAANLIAWCLSHNTEAHWDAANESSCDLAIKLGYTPAESYVAYYLKE